MKKNLNENYFSNLNDENVLYWLGFLMADGCIYNNSLKMALAERDKDHMEKLKQDLDTDLALTKNISYCSKRNPKWKDSVCYHITIRSNILIADLASFGILPKKTFTSEFPQNLLNHKFLNSYMRGYFDGDGCFCFHNASTRKMKPQLVTAVRGSHSFLKTFNEVLVHKAGLPQRCLNKKINNSSSVGGLIYNGNNISTQIAKYLYKDLNDSSRYLYRKYEIALPFLI